MQRCNAKSENFPPIGDSLPISEYRAVGRSENLGGRAPSSSNSRSKFLAGGTAGSTILILNCQNQGKVTCPTAGPSVPTALEYVDPS